MKKFLVGSRVDLGESFSKQAQVCASEPWDAVKKYVNLLLDKGFSKEEIGDYEFSVVELEV